MLKGRAGSSLTRFRAWPSFASWRSGYEYYTRTRGRAFLFHLSLAHSFARGCVGTIGVVCRKVGLATIWVAHTKETDPSLRCCYAEALGRVDDVNQAPRPLRLSSGRQGKRNLQQQMAGKLPLGPLLLLLLCFTAGLEGAICTMRNYGPFVYLLEKRYLRLPRTRAGLFPLAPRPFAVVAMLKLGRVPQLLSPAPLCIYREQMDTKRVPIPSTTTLYRGHLAQVQEYRLSLPIRPSLLKPR